MAETEAIKPAVEADAKTTPSKDDKSTSKKKLVQVDLSSPNAAPPSGPKDRDIIFGEGEDDHTANLLLQDLIALHQVVWNCSQEEPPKAEKDVEVVTERLFQLLKKGKGRDLAGMKDVPTPFLVGSGRFLQKDGSEWNELSDDQAKKLMKTLIFTALKKEDKDSDESAVLKDLRKEFLAFLASAQENQQSETELVVVETKATDVILLQRSDTDSDKSFNNQSGNKNMFALASQYVNSEVTTAQKRLEAALSVFLSKQPAAEESTAEDTKMKEEPDKEKPRFVLCEISGENELKKYSLVKPVDAAEVTLMFVFEVWMEKELAAKRDASGFSASDPVSQDWPKPSTDPVDSPTPNDVLFGRGGMTNSHVGNKRFRDVIALHRPDYIRAIKNDKPNVARRIVRAIRSSDPPGRFLKKSDDGKWRDVGDKVAAEKASQALREKSNTEKRQRSAQRDSMRSKGDADSAAPSTKKAKTGDVSISSPLLASTQLNYVGAPNTSTTVVADGAKKGAKDGKDGLKTEGLPPNAVDKDGNILVTDWDILSGRGGLTNHHRGNKRFRDIVALHRPDYIRAPKVSKPSVARVIVRAIRNGDPPGRFLRKDEKTGKWYDMGDKRAAEKTSQALREKGGDKESGAAGADATAEDGKSPAYLLPALADAKPEGGAAAPDVKADETPQADATKAEAGSDKAPEGADAKASTNDTTKKEEEEPEVTNTVTV